jgi:hypothetical protein
MTNTLAYNFTELITVVKSFIMKGLGVNFQKEIGRTLSIFVS